MKTQLTSFSMILNYQNPLFLHSQLRNTTREENNHSHPKSRFMMTKCSFSLIQSTIFQSIQQKHKNYNSHMMLLKLCMIIIIAKFHY